MFFLKRMTPNGFTLVELAIVLMIIGLLIGGILRGQELLNNARVSSTVQQVKAYHGAYVTFRDQYGAGPGDYALATTRLPGCTPANFCFSGDGNTIIGQPGLQNTDNISQAGTNTNPMSETTQFWKHLALSHLISGINPSADPTHPEWGQTHPAAKVGGGFTVFYAAEINGTQGDKGFGNDLRLQGNPTSTGIDQFSAVSPIIAFQIDKKMDDGLGDSGSVTGDHEWNCDPGGNYMVSEEKTCFMYFMLD